MSQTSATPQTRAKNLDEAVAYWTNRCRAFFMPDQVIELRALGVQYGNKRPCIEAGYFESARLNLMVRYALNLTRNAKGVYFTMNPVKSDLLARRCNRIDYADPGTLTKDQDIVRRRWLLIDVDPVRDPHISATDSEKAIAFETVQAVRDHLATRSWPAPILADSGNGYHLFYRIDAPADDGGRIQRLLRSLATRFDNEHAKIDTSVYNPARIVKLPGTLARKGDAVPTRPHRRADLLETPQS